ncbi:MAG: group II truncated hemoglobin [Burkholderiales bacterium]|nr:group II truncated hemoglobin [Burkholderiales bacterium]MDE2505213.1 group II truncated hemoglobin [Burkholderiales bacterium]
MRAAAPAHARDRAGLPGVAGAGGAGAAPDGGHVSAPAATAPYAQIGGDAGVRALVDRFYDLMDLEPAYAALRALHPTTLEGSRDKLYWFLSGWLGGPDLYVERHGHPRLRARHLPFVITRVERDQWLACMQQAMAELGLEGALAQRLAASFFDTADWMRNTPDPAPDHAPDAGRAR